MKSVKLWNGVKPMYIPTFHICWGAQAGLYYHYGVPKFDVSPKIFGVYKHHLCVENERLFRGFDDESFMYLILDILSSTKDLEKIPELTILAESDDEAGVYAIANLKNRQFFITGHAEYDPLSLKGNMTGMWQLAVRMLRYQRIIILGMTQGHSQWYVGAQ